MSKKLFESVQQHGFIDDKIVQSAMRIRKNYSSGRVAIEGDMCTTFEVILDGIRNSNGTIPVSDHRFCFPILDKTEIITFSIRYVKGTPIFIPQLVSGLVSSDVLHPCYSLRFQILLNNENDDFLMHELEHRENSDFIAHISFQDIEKFIQGRSLHMIILTTICFNKEYFK